MQINGSAQAKADEYREFLQTRLQSDLDHAYKGRHACVQEQDDYESLENNIELLIKVWTISPPRLIWSFKVK